MGLTVAADGCVRATPGLTMDASWSSGAASAPKSNKSTPSESCCSPFCRDPALAAHFAGWRQPYVRSPSVPHVGRADAGTWPRRHLGPHGWPTTALARRAAPPPRAALCIGPSPSPLDADLRPGWPGGAATGGRRARLDLAAPVV